MRQLPDQFEREDLQGQTSSRGFAALNWVGMSGFVVPLAIPVGDQDFKVMGNLDAYLSLDSESHRGIHMSRIYKLLQNAFSHESIWEESAITTLCEQLIESQQGISENLKLNFKFEYPREVKALVSDEIGWRAYPVELTLGMSKGKLKISVQSEVLYSSTCPCSAGLARELNFEAFQREFEGKPSFTGDEIRTWLKSKKSLAGTPHAQRSRARFVVEPEVYRHPFQLITEVIEGLEAAFATPVQTLVKRDDEKEFAKRNAENLMFCEDAARRAKSYLDGLEGIEAYSCEVRHMESLHAHDAVSVTARGKLSLK